MKPFLQRLAGGRGSFRGLGMGETAALSLSKGMRRGQGSPVNKSLKKPAREPWNERNGFMAYSNAAHSMLYLGAFYHSIGFSNRYITRCSGKKDIHIP